MSNIMGRFYCTNEKVYDIVSNVTVNGFVSVFLKEVENMNYPVIDLKATGSNIKKLRKRNDFSVAQLQEFFGFEYPNAIYKWQKGESLPTVDNLLALSMLFRVSMNDILVFEGQDFLIVKLFNHRLKLFNYRFIEMGRFLRYNSTCNENN